MHHGPSLGCSEATDCPARLQPSTAVVCCWLGAAASLELHAWPPSPPSNAACSFCQGRVSIVVSQCALMAPLLLTAVNVRARRCGVVVAVRVCAR